MTVYFLLRSQSVLQTSKHPFSSIRHVARDRPSVNCHQEFSVPRRFMWKQAHLKWAPQPGKRAPFPVTTGTPTGTLASYASYPPISPSLPRFCNVNRQLSRDMTFAGQFPQPDFTTADSLSAHSPPIVQRCPPPPANPFSSARGARLSEVCRHTT